MPKLSRIFTWILYFIPVYIFILDPILRPIFPNTAEPSEPNIWESEALLDDWEDTKPALNLEDDSFISPEDGVPTNCPGEAPGYRVHLLSRTPLIMYIENFVSDEEADHLVDIRYHNSTSSQEDELTKNPASTNTVPLSSTMASPSASTQANASPTAPSSTATTPSAASKTARAPSKAGAHTSTSSECGLSDTTPQVTTDTTTTGPGPSRAVATD